MQMDKHTTDLRPRRKLSGLGPVEKKITLMLHLCDIEKQNLHKHVCNSMKTEFLKRVTQGTASHLEHRNDFQIKFPRDLDL